MLRQLSIKNFAIVESVFLDFRSGFTVLTGETGAGKSLIVDALYFLLGDRINSEMLRIGEERAAVEALFQISLKSTVIQKLSEWGIPITKGELLIKREFYRSSGKSRSFVNGEMATASMISELGDWLIDIHGQHEHQAIFNIKRHRQLIDAYGHLEDLLEKTSLTYETLSKLLNEQSKLGGDSREIARRTDLLEFQLDEIESSRLETLDEEEFLKKHNRMKHSEKILNFMTDAQKFLDEEGEGGASGLFGTVVSRLIEAAKLDPELDTLLEMAKNAQENLSQLSFDISKKLGTYNFNSSEFEESINQIDNLNSMKKKYGVSIVEILKYLNQIRDELNILKGRVERLKSIEREIESASEEYRLVSRQLSCKRIQMGEKLALQVQKILKELGLTHAQVSIHLTPMEDSGSPVIQEGKHLHLSPWGWDRVEFLFSANPGEPLRPLAKVASGGEASRVMLALKSVLAEGDEIPTLIFDEIDTGVGARTAPAVAQLLSRLSETKQVLCVSHLAPIAGLGENHFQIVKTIFDGKTTVIVHRLSEIDRIDELAKMLGGEPISETSRSHAKELYDRMRAK